MDPAMARMLAAARGGRPGEAPPAPGADAPVPDKYDLLNPLGGSLGSQSRILVEKLSISRL